MEEALTVFIAEHKECAGIVSLDTPLISNLTVLGNISLIKQYREDVPRQDAEKLVLGCLARFNETNIAAKRNPALSDEERFIAMLLRAAMVPRSIILIDRPFKIMPELGDSCFIENALDKIADLYNQCVIFDYQWNKDRYSEKCQIRSN
ncbi:MAG: hypothetical protein PHY31_00240 [Smithellaceae bacterium]|nr:hypothetical protein [Smithellaceae bacterium]